MAQPKIGTLVHAWLSDGRCAPGWIVTVEVSDPVRARVQGFRDQDTAIGMFIGGDKPHGIPEAAAAVEPYTEETEAVTSWHLPDECPWDR